MDEAVLADIDAYVGIGASRGVEEHEVAGGHLAAVQRRTALAHLLGRAGQVHVGGALHHVANQAAAIETGIGGVAAVAVGGAYQRHRLDRDFLKSGARVDHRFAGCPGHGRTLPGRRPAGAGGQ
jgi:hypothetical protein